MRDADAGCAALSLVGLWGALSLIVWLAWGEVAIGILVLSTLAGLAVIRGIVSTHR